MRSRPLVALLSLLQLGTLYGQTPQQPDSLQIDSLPAATEHILAPESVSSKALARIDSLAEAGLRMGAYPGCQIFAFYQGEVLVNKAYGSLTSLKGRQGEPVTPQSIYDLASITKAAATTPALMLLVGEKKINLSSQLLSYLPETKETLLGMVTIRQQRTYSG